MGTPVSAQLCDGDPADIFSVPLTAGEVISAEAVFTHADGDIDTYLFDPSGTTVANSATDTDNEMITHTVAVTGTYTVYVGGVSPDTRNSYTLSVSTAEPMVTFPQPTLFIDTDSPQNVSGTVTDTGVDRVEIVGIDLGAAGATGTTGLRAWNSGGAWEQVADAPVLRAAIGSEEWSFDWDPVPGGSGSYVIGIRAFDDVGNKWPANKNWQALVVISDTTRPTVTATAPTANGSTITWAGAATEDVAVRKVRMIIRHVDTNEYWNGTDWVAADQAGADPKVLLTADLSTSLGTNPSWSYQLTTDRTGAFQTLTWAQNGAYLYSTPAPTSINR
jgi:hypothetical protein